MKKIFLFTIVLFLVCELYAFDFVRDGKPCAEIVLPDGGYAGYRFAAEDFQNHILAISGVKLDIVAQPTGQYANRIFIGENKYTKDLGYKLPEFHNSGYDILIEKDYMILAGPETIYPRLKFDPSNPRDLERFQEFMGEKYTLEHFDAGGGRYRPEVGGYANDDVGTWHAVSAALELLGVRFYAPYEDGTVIPKNRNASLPEGRITKEAAYGRREWLFYASEKDGQLWLKRMKCGVRTGVIFNHTLKLFLKASVNKTKHPTWYTESEPGKMASGTFGQGGIPRLSDPDFQKACAEWMDKLFTTYPNLDAVTLGTPDGAFVWDWRDREKYFKDGITEKQAYANLMWDWHSTMAAALKKTHPSKKILWWCQYNDCIPTNIDKNNLPDNIIYPPVYIFPSRLVMDHFRRQTEDYPVRMTKTFGNIGKGPGWEWWLDYRSPSSPRYPVFYPHVLKQYRQFMRKYSDGMFAEIPQRWEAKGERTKPRCWRLAEDKLMAPMMYINNKLLWDPDLNMQELLDEYYRLYFGPAEKEMKMFFEFAEEVWCRNESRSVTVTNGFLKETDVPKFFQLLADAKSKTDPDSVYRRRIQYLEDGYAPLKKIFEALKCVGPEKRIYCFPAKPLPDGNTDNYRNSWMTMAENMTSVPISQNKTEASFYLSQDRKFFYVFVRCWEAKMKNLRTGTLKKDDDALFNDDAVEVYINTPERNCFKIAVNPEGTIWDSCSDTTIIARDSMPILWNPDIKVWAKKYDDRWEVELMIPTDDFGAIGPTKQYPWGVNICRTRICGKTLNEQEFYSVAPTGGSYSKTKYWLRIYDKGLH